MKEVVSKFIKTFGCDTGYSGSLRIMYIKQGERANEALRAVRDKWPNLAFYVRVTEDIPAEAQEEKIVLTENSTTADVFKAIHQQDQQNAEDAEKYRELVAEAGLTAVSGKDAAIELREKVDAYLIQYQNNKNEKGFYTAAATFLNTNAEYVRDRYRKLKKKGLVETQSTNA